MKPLQIGVCTWSLAIPDLAETLAAVKDKLGLGLIQLGFMDDGYRNPDKLLETVRASGLELSATCLAFPGEDYSSIQRIAATGGYLPDDQWANRLAKSIACADLTAALGVKLIDVHIGFVPHDKTNPKHAVMVDRIKRICDEFGRRGLTLVMETGQEKATDLLSFIAAVGRSNIGVNFDPANMILYGVGEPLEAVGILGSRIVHVHMKDANWSAQPGQQWGEEVVLGSGEANIPQIVSKLRASGYQGPLVIEREAGNQRLADIKEAIDLLQAMLC